MASVTAVVDLGDGQRVTMTGTISVEGELHLNSGQVVPADSDFNAQAENWRSRADTPSRMTGTYDLVVTVPGLSGSARMNLRLDNVAKISASTAAADRGASLGSKLRSRIRSRVSNRH